MVTRRQAGYGVMLLILGFLLVTQVRAARTLRAETGLPSKRTQELAALIQQQQAARQVLEREVQGLRARLVEYQQAIVGGRGLATVLADEALRYRMVLGLTPLEGPGVVVVLEEGRRSPVGITAPATQAQDLSGLVNELWAAGAEAVSINRQRLLSTTGFAQVGGTIMAGPHRVSPPFTIEAIGDPAVLESTLRLRGGFADGLQSVGLAVTVTRSARLRLPAYQGPLVFRHARPVP